MAGNVANATNVGADMTASTTLDVRRATDRFHSRLSWLDSWHSFSFSNHYDPSNTRHGLLLVSNDDVIGGGGGFGTHAHSDMEIVTWVLNGELVHRDSEGNHGVLYPGLAQRMSAGSGIRHSEHNGSQVADVRLVQMWVLPDTTGVKPSYQQVDVNTELDRGGLVLVAAGGSAGADAAVTVHQRDAQLWVGRLRDGETVSVPDAPHTHVFVAVGGATLGADDNDAAALSQGDAARLTGAGPIDLRAGADGAEVIIWATA